MYSVNMDKKLRVRVGWSPLLILINLVLYSLFNDEVLYKNTKENYNTSIEKTLQFIELPTLWLN